MADEPDDMRTQAKRRLRGPTPTDPDRPSGAGGSEPTELGWVTRALGGDRAAFDRIVHAFYPGVYATAFRLLGNPEDAEDLAQECFVRAHRSLGFFRGEGSLAGWLRRIVVHLARDRFRSAGRRPAGLPLAAAESVASERGPLQELGQRELSRALTHAVGELPDHLRVPLVLRTQEGLSYDAIADATGVTPATVRTQVMKARRELQRRLGPHLAPPDPESHGDRRPS